MKNKVRIGIIKETKKPIDRRVVLTPQDCEFILKCYSNVEIYIESSKERCFKDELYESIGVKVVDVVSDCDYFLGVKEVNTEYLVPNGKYLFFSHTIKGQSYNMSLLNMCLDKKITLIDFEVIRKDNKRIIAFGEIAGFIGAYESIRGYLFTLGYTQLNSASEYTELDELVVTINKYDKLLPKLLFTGKGAVGRGIKNFLLAIGYKENAIGIFHSIDQSEKVFCNVSYKDYYRNEFMLFDENEFNEFPDKYVSIISELIRNVPLIIFGHYHKSGNPILLEDKGILQSKVRCIGDISCDIGFPIQSTIKSTTITDPFYYYNCVKSSEVEKIDEDSILVMSVDNLPCEMPIEASKFFSNLFVNNVLPELLKSNSTIIDDATICNNGKLTPNFIYLENYLN